MNISLIEQLFVMLTLFMICLTLLLMLILFMVQLCLEDDIDYNKELLNMLTLFLANLVYDARIVYVGNIAYDANFVYGASIIYDAALI